MNARQAFDEFFAYAMSLGGMRDWEVGLMYDVEQGWRVYQRIGDKALALGHGTTRKVAEHSIRRISRMSDAELRLHKMDRAATEPLLDTFKTLRDLAAEAKENNRIGKVPDGYAEMMPTAGHA